MFATGESVRGAESDGDQDSGSRAEDGSGVPYSAFGVFLHRLHAAFSESGESQEVWVLSFMITSCIL